MKPLHEIHETGRSLQSGYGLALVAALGLVNGCGLGKAADASEQPSNRLDGEPTDTVARADTEAIYTCTLAQGTIRGSLRVFLGPESSTCSITAELPNSSRVYCSSISDFDVVCPDCESLRRDLGCFLVL